MHQAMRGKTFIASLLLAFLAAAGSFAPASAEAQSADLSVAVTAPASAVPGTDLSYAITITNNGPDVTGAAELLVSTPGATTFVSVVQNSGPTATCSTPAVGTNGSILCTLPAVFTAGTSADFTVVVHVPANATGGVTNIVNAISIITSDPNSANDGSSTFTALVPSADLSLVKSGPATVNAGSPIAYSITLANAGPSDAQSVALGDSIPAGATFVSLSQSSGPTFNCTTPAVGSGGTVTCTIATLAAGATASFDLAVAVPAATADGAILSNTATLGSATADPANANNASTASTTVSAKTDLSLTKTAPATVTAGSTLTYDITVANASANAAQAVALSDALPAGTAFVSLAQTAGPAFTCTTPAVGANGSVSCSLATFAAGATASFTLTTAVDVSVAAGTSIVNTASVASATADANAGNNSATASSIVSPTVTFSGPSATGTGTITASFTGGGPTCSFANARLIPVTGDPASPPASSAPVGVVFPHGLFTFTITGCTPAATLAFTITYPSPVSGNYWKYGPKPGVPASSWYMLPATFSGNTVTFSITDGGLGDDDLAANGTVVDQGGPGVGGAAVAPTPVPTLSQWMLALLAMLVLGAGLRRIARRSDPGGS
jgi:uncharacterized repeat protein (TIGR01451 family)